jgi:copper chaperone CopZ
MNTELQITGMKCGGCVSAVKDALSKVKGVSAVDVSLDEKRATVTGEAEKATLVAAVESAGFKAG